MKNPLLKERGRLPRLRELLNLTGLSYRAHLKSHTGSISCSWKKGNSCEVAYKSGRELQDGRGADYHPR